MVDTGVRSMEGMQRMPNLGLRVDQAIEGR